MQQTASAEFLQLQPLEYRESLQPAQKKEGFIDVTNPQSSPISVAINVRGFRQIDDRGNLAFYEDGKLSAGILPDKETATIPPNKTLRLYFVIDGTKLPSGDIFAAIFVQTTSQISTATNPSVRLGTLLMLTNGTPTKHDAQITSLHLPWINTSTSLGGTTTIKNTAPTNTSNGFFPTITVKTWPFGATKTFQGPLVYAGISRSVEFSLPSEQVGVYNVSVNYGNSSKNQWVVMLPNTFLPVYIAIAVSVVLGILVLVRKRRHQTKKR